MECKARATACEAEEVDNAARRTKRDCARCLRALEPVTATVSACKRLTKRSSVASDLPGSPHRRHSNKRTMVARMGREAGNMSIWTFAAKAGGLVSVMARDRGGRNQRAFRSIENLQVDADSSVNYFLS